MGRSLCIGSSRGLREEHGGRGDRRWAHLLARGEGSVPTCQGEDAWPETGKRERREKGESSKYGPLFGCGNYSSRLLRCFFFSRQPLERKAKVPKEKGKERPNNNCSMAECCCMPVGVWLKSSEK